MFLIRVTLPPFYVHPLPFLFVVNPSTLLLFFLFVRLPDPCLPLRVVAGSLLRNTFMNSDGLLIGLPRATGVARHAVRAPPLLCRKKMSEPK